jgi:hypothetical protein
METRLGTCGWSFRDWKGTFYPPGTKDELAYYASQFDAVEIDSNGNAAAVGADGVDDFDHLRFCRGKGDGVREAEAARFVMQVVFVFVIPLED